MPIPLFFSLPRTRGMIRRSRTIGVCLVAGFGAVACRAEPAREFRVGLLHLDSGPSETVSGVASLRGARLAVEELNAAGGVTIAGSVHRVVLIERGFEDRADAAASAARALVNIDRVDAIIGPQFSAHAIAAASVAEVSGVPMISPMASNPAVTADRQMVSRLAFLDEFQGALLATYAFDTLRLRRAGVLHDAASAYGQEITRLFRATFEARGGTVVGVETFASDAGRDHRAQLRRLIARQPDAILLTNIGVIDSAQIVQARALGFRGRFLGSDSWDPKLLVHVPGAEGSIVVTNWDVRTERPSAQEFIAKYESRYQSAPRTTAAATYDAIRILAKAVTRAGALDGAAIARAIRESGVQEGATSRFEFRGTGDPVRGGVILEILQGRDSLRHVAAPR